MKRIHFLVPLAVTFVVALIVRILYNITAGRGYVAQFDAAEYERLALHLLNEHCFCNVSHVSSVARAPFWPGVIAFIYGIFGPNNLNVRLFLSVLGSVTCVLVYLFAKDLFGKRFGLVAGIIAACYPELFVYDGWLYSESLYTFLFLAFTYTLYRFQRTFQRRWLIMSAVALAFSALTRANGLFTIGMLLVFALIVGWKRIIPWHVIAKATIGITLISSLIIIPWSIRNYAVSHYIVPVATGSSTILAGAYNNTVFTNPFLGATGMWVPPDMAKPSIQYRQKCCTISGEEPNQQAYAFDWMRTHLKSMPRLLTLHFINIWRPILPDGALPISQFPDRFTSKVIKVLFRVFPMLVFVFAAVGLLATWKRKWDQLLSIYLAIGLTIVQCVALYGSVRFRAPIEPMLVILATGGLWWITQFWYHKALFKAQKNSTQNVEIGDNVGVEAEHKDAVSSEQHSLVSDQMVSTWMVYSHANSKCPYRTERRCYTDGKDLLHLRAIGKDAWCQ